MASTPSSIGNVEQIGVGDALNTWGFSLNAALERMTEMGVGVTSISLTGNKTLTTTNYVANESRWGGIRFADGGLSAAPTVTFPAETRSWLVINTGSTYAVNCLAAGSGVSAVSVDAGKWAIIDCDGVDLFINDLSNLSGLLPIEFLQSSPAMSVLGNLTGAAATPGGVTVITDLASASDTTLATSAASKAYTDALRAYVDALPQINTGIIQDNLPAINTVATNIGSVNTVAVNMQTIIDNAAAIQTAAANIDNINTAVDRIIPELDAVYTALDAIDVSNDILFWRLAR